MSGTSHAKNNQGSSASMAEKSGIVFIGNKPAMSYVTAVLTNISSSNTERIILKARGRAITTAVDVAEIVRNRFLKDFKVRDISIGTEEMPAREGGSKGRMVSAVEMILARE